MVPTGYSFNLDGTAIYLTMASLFIAEALGDPLTIGEQISLLVFMVIASKGAAGVTGPGLATLAGGLSSHRPELLDGVGLDRRHRPLHVRGPRADQLRGQLGRHRAHRHWTDGGPRAAGRGARRDGPFDETTMLDETPADRRPSRRSWRRPARPPAGRLTA